MSKVSLKMDPIDKIIIKRSVGKNGKAALFLANEIRRLSDPYVPMANGTLKDTAVVTPGKITYDQPYARRQWYEHRGNGLRGPRWCERMWANRGKEIVHAVAKYVGGKSG